MFNTLGTICSILGLVIAFIQLHSAKKKILSTQNALTELRDVLSAQKIEVLFRILSIQQEELLKLITNLNKPGFSVNYLDEKLQKIIIELNKCDNELPDKYEKISRRIGFAIESLESALQPEGTEKFRRDCLVDADGYLKNCIHGLNKAIEDKLDKTVNTIARGK